MRGFYEQAAEDDFDGAWKLAGTDLRSAWNGSQDAFEADLRSLESIDFDRLEVTDQDGESATVAIKTRARHATYVDNCSGTIPATRTRRGWRLGRPAINCRRTPV